MCTTYIQMLIVNYTYFIAVLAQGVLPPNAQCGLDLQGNGNGVMRVETRGARRGRPWEVRIRRDWYRGAEEGEGLRDDGQRICWW